MGSLPTSTQLHPAAPAADTAAIERLIEVVRLRDPALANHGQRTAHVAAAIAMEMGLDTAGIDRAYLGAQLHDLGKLGVAEAVLWKPAGLTRGEWRQIRTHPEKGHRLVAGLVHSEVAAAVLSHHERADGGGYPHGVDGSALPLVVRIVQVADAYDAITSHRPYAPAVDPESAVIEIARCAPVQFDADVAAALGSLLAVAIHPDGPIRLEESTRRPSLLPRDPFTIDLAG